MVPAHYAYALGIPGSWYHNKISASPLPEALPALWLPSASLSLDKCATPLRNWAGVEWCWDLTTSGLPSRVGNQARYKPLYLMPGLFRRLLRRVKGGKTKAAAAELCIGLAAIRACGWLSISSYWNEADWSANSGSLNQLVKLQTQTSLQSVGLRDKLRMDERHLQRSQTLRGISQLSTLPPDSSAPLRTWLASKSGAKWRKLAVSRKMPYRMRKWHCAIERLRWRLKSKAKDPKDGSDDHKLLDIVSEICAMVCWLCCLSMLFQLHLGCLILVDQDRQGGLYQPWHVEYCF